MLPLPKEPADEEEEDEAGERTRSAFSDAAENLMSQKDADGVIIGYAGIDASTSRARWFVREGKPSPDDNDAYDSAAFFEILDACGKTPGVLRMQFQILSRADAEKLSETND